MKKNLVKSGTYSDVLIHVERRRRNSRKFPETPGRYQEMSESHHRDAAAARCHGIAVVDAADRHAAPVELEAARRALDDL